MYLVPMQENYHQIKETYCFWITLRHVSKDTKDSLKSLGYDVEELSAFTTKYLQPLDISVNRAFKSQITDEWENYSASLKKTDVTKAGNLWISKACDKISADVIANG